MSLNGKKKTDKLYQSFSFIMVELTGLAPVYQRTQTKLSPYTVYFYRHTVKKANKLTVSRHLELR